MAELCKEFELHASQIIEWKRKLLQGAADVFASGSSTTAAVDLAPLHAKIGQLALENDFLERALTKAGLLRIGNSNALFLAYGSTGNGTRHS